MKAKAIVDEVLGFLAKKLILIKDMFCLGKYARSTSMPPAHPRPTLVKLSTAWDVRVTCVSLELGICSGVRMFHLITCYGTTSSLRDGRSSADTPDAVPGPVQTCTNCYSQCSLQ